VYVNLMTVMLLGGLWHGASWTFVIWGAIHGCMLAFERMQGKTSPYRLLPAAVRIAITFTIVCIGWVFFRAESLGVAGRYLKTLVGLVAHTEASDLLAGVIYTPFHITMFLICAAVIWTMPQVWNFTQRLNVPKAILCIATFAVSLVLLWTQTVNPFLYYQF
jgi:alginate O-acetyltransferase complex protein AlgI